jgi:hypothetical protein
VKKGRHRRFEEARKLKQAGSNDHHQPTQDDEYAALAEKYGVTFDDDEEDESED